MTDESQFLTRFPAKVRSLIANQFCYAVREGYQDPRAVVAWVTRDAIKRIQKRSQWTTEAQIETQQFLLKQLPDPSSLEFAKFIIWRESLSPEIREKQKAEAGKVFRDQYLSQAPPTEKQLAYLRSLRCPTIPKSKLEASQLIERFKK